MKRKPAETHPLSPYRIFTIWQVFYWKQCCVCGMEFRREPGFCVSIQYRHKRQQGIRIDGSTETADYCYCGTCCPTAAEAESFFLTQHGYEYYLKDRP